ncbi:hypothetical protein SRABI83_01294 [Arthrobacter sp. Bi83]|uniref:hypothetical protein n=1 Tax=Arthrobacter sp. Bi83 TaxID=2822353 RepID=UPI001D3CCA97|nr:hypothetical protein [Arthrobacter sp. Bi83]CAH0175406.1 hypothetical protein SRABI83_01294 [Arthrobacter sp. Bi83]
MTELNPDSHVEAASLVSWPEPPPADSGAGGSEGISVVDGTVHEILDQVREIPGLPVSEHPAAYTAMHDALLEALNDDTPSGAGAA